MHTKARNKKSLLKILLTLCLLTITFLQVNAQKKKVENALNNIDVIWQIEENGHDGKFQSLTSLELTNKNKKALPAKGWTIYFNFARMIVPGSATGADVQIEHVNGDLFKITPSANFQPLAAGKSFKVSFVSSDWVVNFTDAPTGFYIVSQGAEKGFSLNNVKAVPSTESKQYLRFSGDKIGLITPQDIYQKNAAIKNIEEAQLPKIFPTPVSYKETNSVFNLSTATKITGPDAFTPELNYLVKQTAKLVGSPTQKLSEITNSIELKQNNLPEGAYALHVKDNAIVIEASSGEGIFYGIQSLLSLVSPTAFAKTQKVIAVPTVEVEDAPRFGYRAFFLDVARNFQTKQELLRVLDLLALYKLNVLHLHFSDDEAWRVEIPSLPELTQVGSVRGYKTDSKKILQSTLGSGPDTNTIASGHYSRQDFVEILRYATERHIQVIPEIESPGHARAAIKAMNARYEKYMKLGDSAKAKEFLLYDLQDTSNYMSVQFYNDNVMNVALPSVYSFVETVVNDLAAMYKEANAPLKTVHMGGDEVPAGVWEKSPVYLSLKEKDKNIQSTDDLWYYYFGRVNNILKARGLFLSGWEEAALRKTMQDGGKKMIPNPDFVNEHFQVDVWNNVLGWGAEDLAYQLANSGYKVVLSCVSNQYFDMAYYKDFEEPGYYWGGYVDVDKLFYFVPFDYFKNSREDKFGNPLDKSIFIGKQRLTDYGKSNIVGIKGLLWAETLISSDRMEYMLLPKLLGLSERAWSKDPDWATEKDSAKSAALYADAWSTFVNVVGKRELPRLNYYAGGFNYRIPSPGAKVENGKVYANIQLPGFTIRYTVDGKEPTATSNIYKEPIGAQGTIKLRAFDERGRGGRSAEVKNN